MYSAIALLCINFTGDPDKIGIPALTNYINSGHSARLNRLLWWGGISIFFYMIVPVIYLLIRRNNLSSFGLSSLKFRGNGIYILLYISMLPLIFIASSSEAFQLKYPFYYPGKNEGFYPWFFIWEGMYFLQFIALEFFFRGFMVHGLKARFGMHSILIMTIPYCMIHFSKPMPEAMGSILAGLILGYLSLKKNNIIPGALLHFAIALTMDLLALWQRQMF